MRARGQFNFSWIFALIVGGAILVLAIYGAVNAGNTQRGITETKIARSLSVLIDPLQAGFSDASFGVIEFRDVTRLNNFCFDDGFGSNKISVATRSDVLDEWNIAGVETVISNKYIFSEERVESENYYVFSMPFEFPYKVSDLIFLTSHEYCFINAPKEVLTDVTAVENIKTKDCSGEDNLINVCFGSGADCDVEVFGSCRSRNCDSLYDEGTVSSVEGQVKYVGSLMYGAIFASEEVYTCNVNRLLYRTGRVAEVLTDKADLMNLRGCNTNLRTDIAIFGEKVINSSYENLLMIDYGELGRKNDLEVCGLWS